MVCLCGYCDTHTLNIVVAGHFGNTPKCKKLIAKYTLLGVYRKGSEAMPISCAVCTPRYLQFRDILDNLALLPAELLDPVKAMIQTAADRERRKG